MESPRRAVRWAPPGRSLPAELYSSDRATSSVPVVRPATCCWRSRPSEAMRSRLVASARTCRSISETSVLLFSLSLLGQNRFEHGFFEVGFEAATGWIDEGIRRAGFEFGILFCHAVFGGVVTERDVTGQCADHCEGVVEFIHHGGRQHGGRAQAGVEDDLVSLACFAHGHRPSGCAAGVASGEM